jgi:hypothetical protein
MMMMPRPSHHYHRRTTTTARDLAAGTDADDDDKLTPIEAGLAGLGVGALWVFGTGGKLLLRTLAVLPESMEYVCLAGAVAGALTSTGLWAARRTARNWDVYRHFVFPGTFTSLL